MGVQVHDEVGPGAPQAAGPSARRGDARSPSRPARRRARRPKRPCASRVGTKATTGSTTAAGQHHASHQLGDGRRALVVHHGRGREVIAEEQVLFGQPGAAMPPRGLGIRPGRAESAGGRAKVSWSLQSTANDVLTRGLLRRAPTPRRERRGPSAARRRASPSGWSFRSTPHHEGEGVLDLAIGEQVLGATPVDHHAETLAVGATRGRRGRHGPGSDGRDGRRPTAKTMPTNKVRTLSCRGRTPTAACASSAPGTPDASTIASGRSRRPLTCAASEKGDRLGLVAGIEVGHHVAEALRADDARRGHEGGQADVGRTTRPARSSAGGPG